jgi:tetratricopeptide (TPR) repeat protein
MQITHRIVSILLMGFVVASASANETINRKRDKAVSGEVTAVSKTDVTIKVTSPKADTLKIPANEIVSIDWTGDAPDLKVARQDENGLRLQKAFDGYLKSQGASKANNPAAKADLEFVIARVTAKMALTDPARLDDAVKKLEDFQRKNGDHYRLYEGIYLLGQLYSAKKDAAKARQTFEQLAKAPWKETQMVSRIAVGRLLLSESHFDEAAAEYEAVIALPAEGPLEVSARQEAMLGKGRILIAQKKYDEALGLFKDVIGNAPSDDAKVNAEAYLRQGDCYREQGNDKEALISYLHVYLLFASEKSMQAEALYRLSPLFDKVGRKDRAEEVREILRSEFESSEWAKLLKSPATTNAN